jgi:hypothetical protein
VLAGESLAGPTSLNNRGEGLLTGLTRDVGAGEGWDGGGRREDEQKSTVMALMFD